MKKKEKHDRAVVKNRDLKGEKNAQQTRKAESTRCSVSSHVEK
jgi:hypothetical protein